MKVDEKHVIGIIREKILQIMRDKSDTLNEWFSFFVDNINKIFDLPFEREMRALRAFAQFTCSCTNMVSDDHVDKLALIIMVRLLFRKVTSISII